LFSSAFDPNAELLFATETRSALFPTAVLLRAPFDAATARAFNPRETLNNVEDAVRNVCPETEINVEVPALRLVSIVPMLDIERTVPVVEPIAKAGAEPSAAVGLIERRAQGVVVAPIPTEPSTPARIVVEATFKVLAKIVVEAWRPALNQIGVEVAFAVAPKLVVGVQENAPPPVPQEVVVTFPDESVVRQEPAEAPRPEVVSAVVEAVPFTVKRAPGAEVPTPTLPFLSTTKLVPVEEPTANAVRLAGALIDA